MLKDKKSQEYLETHDVIDDSYMPSPEKVASLPKIPPEIEERLDKKLDAICKEFGLL